jgi:hypothetical protein
VPLEIICGSSLFFDYVLSDATHNVRSRRILVLIYPFVLHTCSNPLKGDRSDDKNRKKKQEFVLCCFNWLIIGSCSRSQWSAAIVGSDHTGALMFVCCVCCQIEVSETNWSLVQRGPTDCGASFCVIKKPRERGGHSLRWAAEQEKMIVYYPPGDSYSIPLKGDRSDDRNKKKAGLCSLLFRWLIIGSCNGCVSSD